MNSCSHCDYLPEYESSAISNLRKCNLCRISNESEGVCIETELVFYHCLLQQIFYNAVNYVWSYTNNNICRKFKQEIPVLAWHSLWRHRFFCKTGTFPILGDVCSIHIMFLCAIYISPFEVVLRTFDVGGVWWFKLMRSTHIRIFSILWLSVHELRVSQSNHIVIKIKCNGRCTMCACVVPRDLSYGWEKETGPTMAVFYRKFKRLNIEYSFRDTRSALPYPNRRPLTYFA